MERYHDATIVSVRRGSRVAPNGGGQVMLGNIVVKDSTRKVRAIYGGKVLAGFADATASAFSLFDRFETKLQKHQDNLLRSAIDLAKGWRTDRALRHLGVILIVADRGAALIIIGNGDMLDPEDGIATIGSGGSYVQSATRAPMENTDLAPRDVVKKSLRIAGKICIYADTSFVIETLE